VTLAAIAADDCHTARQFDRGWVMVKVPAVTAPALRDALLGGACYASTGVEAEFGVDGETITVQSTADDVRVVDAAGRARITITGGMGRYTPVGDEGFVRLECRAGARRAWSQAFWIIARSTAAIR
jgi:hypothetical protein